MAISLVQDNDSGEFTGATRSSISVTLPSTPTAGDLLVACLLVGNSVTITPPTGWTLLNLSPVILSIRAGVWYKVAAPGESSTITFSLSAASRVALWVGEFSGVDTSNPIDVWWSEVARASKYSGVAADPNYLGGYGLCFIAYITGSSPSTTTNWVYHPANLSPLGNFGHRTSVTDSNSCWGTVWGASDLDQSVACLSNIPESGTQGRVGFDIVLKAAGASAAPAHISGTTNISFLRSQRATGQTISFTLSPPPAAGTLMIMAVASLGTNDIVPPASPAWTLYHQAEGDLNIYPNSPRKLALFYRTSNGTETNTGTFTGGSSLAAVYAEFSGGTPTSWSTPRVHQHNAVSSLGTTNSFGSRKYKMKISGDKLALAVMHRGGATGGFHPTLDNGWEKITDAAVQGIDVSLLYVTGNTGEYVSLRGICTAPSTLVTMGAYMIMLTVAELEGSDHWAWAEDGADSWG